jgi:signal transduction histidine kinase
MTLRRRLVLTTLVAGVPALVALWVVGTSIREGRDDDLFSALVLAHFSPAALDACESSPPSAPIDIPLPGLKRGVFEAFGDASGIPVFTYRRDGRSSQPDAPALPADVIAAVQRGSVPAGTAIDARIAGNRHLVLALPRQEGPCALVLVATPRMGPPGPPPADLLLPLALALVAGLAGIWPVVRRIRRMTLAVRRWDQGAPLDLPREAGRDELGELSRALADSAGTIRRQHADLIAREEALREFIENTTHDIAIPLTVLQGNLSALAREPGTDEVGQAMNEAQYIGALLANLALSAKFQAAAQVETSLDLRDVVLRVVQRNRAMALRLGVQIERSVPEDRVPVRGDPTFTERALSNLVDNALRHNASGGHVAVVLEIEDDGFVLRVADDGPGLTEQECLRVLQRGERGDAARSRGSAGSGLGLSIVARVAQSQGWGFVLKPGETGGLVAELRGPLEATVS